MVKNENGPHPHPNPLPQGEGIFPPLLAGEGWGEGTKHPAFQAGTLTARLAHPDVGEAEPPQALPPQALRAEGQSQGGAEPPGRFRQQAQAETLGEGFGVVVEQIGAASRLQKNWHARPGAAEMAPLRRQAVGGSGGLPPGKEAEFAIPPQLFPARPSGWDRGFQRRAK